MELAVRGAIAIIFIADVAVISISVLQKYRVFQKERLAEYRFVSHRP